MLKITIITASFNSVKTIEQTILSVINQTYKNVEYIIIDGGSNDGTVDIIKKYSDKISYWISEPDNGIFDAINKGFNIATGDYIQVIGSDDALVDDDILSKISMYLSDGIDVLACGRIDVDEINKIQKTFHIDETVYRNFNTDKRIILPNVPTEGLFVKREIRKKYMFDANYKMLGDWKLFMQYLYEYKLKIKFIDIPVAYFSLSGLSSTNYNLAVMEFKQICKELNLDRGNMYNCSNRYIAESKYIIKKVLTCTGIIKFLKINFFNWQAHHCNNKICRWCGRYDV